MDLKTKDEVKIIEVNGKNISIKQYLPIEDKYDIIMISLQKAKEGNIYNSLKLDMFFYLNIIYLYTNLEFTDEDREDEFKLYDILESNGIIERVIDKIPDKEFSVLYDNLQNIMAETIKNNNSIIGLIQSFIYDLPEQAEAIKDILDSLDEDKLKEISGLLKINQ